jgi:hypothetical protein
MAVQIQIRRDTSSNWSSVNPVLASGEIGIETNTNKFKIGNGSSVWNSLVYVNALPSELSSASASLYATISSASIVVNSNALNYANSASAHVNVLAQGYANTAQSNAQTTALGYANSASANVDIRALGYANSASAHVSTVSSNLYVTKTTPLFTSSTIIDLRSASVMFTSASISGISTGGAETANFSLRLMGG